MNNSAILFKIIVPALCVFFYKRFAYISATAALFSARLHEILCSWQQAAAMLEVDEISKEDYDKWRYHYPEFDTTQICAKIPSQQFSDWFSDTLKEVFDES